MSMEQSATTAIDKIGFMYRPLRFSLHVNSEQSQRRESPLKAMGQGMGFLVLDDPILVRQGQRDIVEAL